jgi:hypothetical protein
MHINYDIEAEAIGGGVGPIGQQFGSSFPRGDPSVTDVTAGASS